MITDKEKQSKVEKMQLKYHYDRFSKSLRVEIRDSYCRIAKMPIPTFYRKLADDSFRPLEKAALETIIEEYLVIN